MTGYAAPDVAWKAERVVSTNMPHLRCFGLEDFGSESFAVESSCHG